jgi:membrane-associated phospholipid phosphatase
MKTLGRELHPSIALACTGDRLQKRSLQILRVCFLSVAFLGSCLPGFCQSDALDFWPSAPAPRNDISALASTPDFDVSTLPAGTFDQDANGADTAPSQGQDTERPGLVKRSVKRVLKDQEGIYRGPFKRSNLKWDALVLAGTTVFLIEDRHIENNLPGGHFTLYQATSDVGIAALGAGLGAVWLRGIKTNDAHEKETGELTLETLVNTFLIYTPMQLIAARQRPGEGNGHGDFFKHRAINTSFPGGHAMFTYAMATIVSHEYSQKWVQALAYGVASAVTVSRFLARDHWASDMWVGAALGIGIGAHVFHAHCDPDLSDSCKHHVRFIF